MPPPSGSQARATGQIFKKAMDALPKQTFARLYLDERRSFQKIADLTGVSRQTLTRLAGEYGIPLCDGPQDYPRRGTIDRDWLIEQYVRRRRTLPDLAREKGMSTANMARWAQLHNIPLRRRGGASHDSALRITHETADAPAILRRALTGQFAWQRLRRSAAALPYPTLGEAAQGLGLNPESLVTQINRLEKDLGQSLIERAERGRGMQPAPFATEVAAAVQATTPPATEGSPPVSEGSSPSAVP